MIPVGDALSRVTLVNGSLSLSLSHCQTGNVKRICQILQICQACPLRKIFLCCYIMLLNNVVSFDIST